MAGEAVTRRELAAELGVSPQAVSKAVAAQRLTRGPDGKFDREASLAAWRATAGGHGAETGRFGGRRPDDFGSDRPENGHANGGLASEGYYRGRAVRETFRAKMARLEFERQSGLLVPADAVRRTFYEAFRAVRDGLEVLPERLDAPLAAEADRAKVREILRAEIRRVLADLSAAAKRQAEQLEGS